MFISELPVEIVSRILINVPNSNNQYECTRVCRLWRREMVPIYYKDTVMYQSYEKFLHEIQTKVDYKGLRVGDFVKTLIFDGIIKTELNQEDFDLLIDTLPSLQAIRFDQSSLLYTVRYMEYLYEIAPRTKLQEVSIVGDLDSIDDYYRYREGCELHYYINEQLKHQITTLSILEASIRYMLGDDQDIFDYIKRFTKLKHLTIYSKLKRERYYSSEAFKDVTFVLDACYDSLQSLQLDIYTNDDLYANCNHIYQPNLTSLTLTTPAFGECYLKYLVDYLSNLKELKVTRTANYEELLSGTYTCLPPDVLRKLNSYLKQLQSFYCKTASYDSSNSSDSFWQMMHEIYDNQAFCNLFIRFYLHWKVFYV